MTLDSLLKYRPPALKKHPIVQKITEPEKPTDTTHTTDSLEIILNEKVQCLSDILGQINYDLISREHLSKNVIYGIYSHYCYLKSKVFELYHWEFGSDRNIELRKSKLEKQLDSLKQEKRQEQVQCWKDIMGLKKEFRNWFKQYCDLMQRAKIIFSGKLPNKKYQNSWSSGKGRSGGFKQKPQ